jgi:hypothetical protein
MESRVADAMERVTVADPFGWKAKVDQGLGGVIIQRIGVPSGEVGGESAGSEGI